MKIMNRIRYFIFIWLLSLFFYTTCKQTTEHNHEVKLYLENGYYQKVSESPNEVKYSIEFDYCVKGIECKVGGYAIHWDENRGGQMNWYMAQTIVPNKTYSISDTFKLSYGITSDPIVTMQGYLENEPDPDSRLRDQCTLKQK